MLGGAAWWIYSNQSGQSTLSDYEGAFAIPDADMIYKVSMQDRNGTKLLLERKEHFWLLNGTYKAESVVMNELMRTLTTVEMAFIPRKSMIPNILKSLGSHGRRVDIWGKGDKLLKSYYVGGVTPDGLGTYFLMEGSNQPFVVKMRGFVGSVSVRYHLQEDDWRDLSVFPIQGQKITRFAVEYPKQRDNSFIIEKKNNGYEVRPFFPITPKNMGTVDQDQVKTYLDRLSYYKMEGYNNDNPDRDSISQVVPFCRISYTTNENQEHQLTFHPMVPTDRRGEILRDASGDVVPVFRYKVNSSWGDFFQVQHEPMKEVFVSYNIFFRGK